MPPGWNAKGLLEPLWKRLPGKRDQLAELSGIRGPTLSAYNSGSRKLGIANARKIVEGFARGDVVISLVEIGGPLQDDDDLGAAFADRLRRIEERLAAIEKLAP